MPSIINRAGVVPDFGEETGGDLPEATEQKPVEIKSADPDADKEEAAKDGSGGELPITKL